MRLATIVIGIIPGESKDKTLSKSRAFLDKLLKVMLHRESSE